MRNILNNDYRRIKRNVILAIPSLFILSIPIHLVYNLTGKIQIVGAFAPVNESVAEHFKLAILPLVLWWVISYYILRKKVDIDFKKWIFSASIATLMIPIVIATFYYTYTGALGISLLIIDIFSLFLALLVAQCLGIHIYKHIRITNEKFYIGLLIIIILISCTIIFTFYPPHIPIFKDTKTLLYGIQI